MVVVMVVVVVVVVVMRVMIPVPVPMPVVPLHIDGSIAHGVGDTSEVLQTWLSVQLTKEVVRAGACKRL